VPRRNLVPVVLLAVLGVGALAFAFLGARSAPSGATLTVQNASSQTFGTPTGSTSFRMDLVASVSAGSGTGTVSQVRQIRYTPPHRMAVYQVTSTTKFIGLLNPTAVTCALSSYTSIVGGSTPWTPSGNAYARTESLADYSGRVPDVSSTTCEPHPSTVHGTVLERASVRAGYLVGVRLTVNVPPQKLSTGTPAAYGTEGEALVMIEINGVLTRHLGS
jgi:hypothetical protein